MVLFQQYDHALVDALIGTVQSATQRASQARIITLEMSVRLLRYVCFTETATGLPKNEGSALRCLLVPTQIRQFEDLYAASLRDVALQYQRHISLGDTERNSFLDVFEREFRSAKPSRIEHVMHQERILLVPTSTPVPGLAPALRLPSDDAEIVTRSIQTFLFLRKFLLDIKQENECNLPLREPTVPLSLRDHAQLEMYPDIIACNVISKNRQAQVVQVRAGTALVNKEQCTRRRGKQRENNRRGRIGEP